MSAPQEPFGWKDESAAYQSRLLREADIAARMELLSQFGVFTVWQDMKAALEQGAEEIRRLRRQIEELTNDAA